MKGAAVCISPLDRSFDRGRFDCGVEELNCFIRLYAFRNQELGISKTWVAHKENREFILGFHTLSAASISVKALPSEISKKLPRYPIPCVLLARLAVDRDSQQRGIGSLLLKDAIEKTIQTSRVVGAFALIVDAKSDRARDFYEKYGFLRLPEQPYTLFLPISTLTQA